jgi:hypothetical protein
MNPEQTEVGRKDNFLIIKKYWWIGAIILLVIVALIVFLNLTKPKENSSNQNTTDNFEKNESKTNANNSDDPLPLKSIGFQLEAYDETTNKAGDIEFTKIPLSFDQIYSPFGQQDPRTTDTTKVNPQPTVILPIGTKVLSLVDGIVIDVKELYSKDWTIMVASSNNSKWIYETEHVNNPLVKKGDRVTGGQVIAEVSDYDTKNTPGFGLVEIGLLHPTESGRPSHVCPYQYLDPSIKDQVNSNLMKLYAAWEKYIGKDVYNQENFVSAGCVTENPFVE